MTKLVVANWKLNPLGLKEAISLAKRTDLKNAIICPPFIFIEEVGKTIKRAKLGAQDAFWANIGAYTGEVSIDQLKRLKVKYIIVGHSERRKELEETDAMINLKIKTAVREKVTPILCIGESKSIYKKGIKATENHLKKQLTKDLSGVKKRSKLIVAYEPIWEIGSKRADTPQRSIKMVGFIRETLDKLGHRGVKILYGGSVHGDNANIFLDEKNIDGVLVGGASLKPHDFRKIVDEAK